MNTSNFLAGALTGLVAGLLLAPQKGEDLREEIAESAQHLGKKISKIARRTGAELDDLRNLLAKEISGLSDDTRHRILTILDEGEDHIVNIKRNLTSNPS